LVFYRTTFLKVQVKFEVQSLEGSGSATSGLRNNFIALKAIY